MQLDQTHVVIRLRTMAEIGDLAMVMVRRYPSAIFTGFVFGCVFWALLNIAVLAWIPLQEASLGLDDEEAQTEIARYVGWMAVLVILQTPVAGVMSTLYLGLAVFEQRPTWGNVFRQCRQQFRRWFWKLGILRFALPPVVLLAFRWGEPASAFWDLVVPAGFLLVASMLRAVRPFMPEILLLEQCPLRSKDESVITANRRSKSLHSPISSDLSGRFITVSMVLFVLLLCLIYTFIWARGITIGQWNLMDLFVLLVIYPVSLWMVAGLSIMVRLLNYLDTRIRLEGWEVELAIRAETQRQFGEPSTLTPNDRSDQNKETIGKTELVAEAMV